MTASQQAYRYGLGQFQKIEAPEWHRNIPDGEWLEGLVGAGARQVEDFGNNLDTVNIFRAPDNSWYIEYSDYAGSVIQVFIDNPADYVHFRATIIAPLVSLIDAQDRVVAEDEARHGLR